LGDNCGMDSEFQTLLWGEYVLTKGPCAEEFWQSHLRARPRHILFVLGEGFDPRMCVGVDTVLKAGGTGQRDCVLIRYDEGADSASKAYHLEVESNTRHLTQAIEGSGRGHIRPQEITMWSNDGRRVGAVEAVRAFADSALLAHYSDVVLDISALPRGMFIPILNKLLGVCLNHSADKKNLHVLVAEDVDLDARIVEEGIDEDASYIPGFGAEIDMVSSAGMPKLWIPVLGENQAAQLQRIRELVAPDETCPMVPFPSTFPRRGDSLLLTPEYCRLFFDDLHIDPSNVLYAHEQNPFQVYRQLGEVVRRYHRAFEPLGGCRAVFSALSSKLLCLGVILAAFELKRTDYIVGMAHVDTKGYRIQDPKKKRGQAMNRELVHLWICGECYDS